MEYHEIGEIFDYKGVKLKVCKSGMCDNCYFEGSLGSKCYYMKCGSQTRRDGNEVIYKQVSDNALEKNNGGSTDYYKLPAGVTELQDLIEYKDMGFGIGNIFKSCYRLGNCEHSDKVRDLNKIIWFARRELNRIK